MPKYQFIKTTKSADSHIWTVTLANSKKMNALSFEAMAEIEKFIIKEKRNGILKGRTVADGSSQHEYTSPSDTAPPTIATESLLLTCVIDAAE